MKGFAFKLTAAAAVIAASAALFGTAAHAQDAKAPIELRYSIFFPPSHIQCETADGLGRGDREAHRTGA